MFSKFSGMFAPKQQILKKRENFETYKNQLWQRVDHVISGLSGIGLKIVPLETQEIITLDKLNAQVDAQVYYKVKEDKQSVWNSMYKVDDVDYQIVALARTTLRNVIGSMNLNDANSDRNKINKDLMDTLTTETTNWGVEIARTELKEINPPKAVQETMNKVVIAQNEKQSATDFAKATETKADGERMAKVKEAEGIKQSLILKAQGEAEAIKLVSESVETNFKDKAQIYKTLEVTRDCLKDNTKYVIDSKTNVMNILSDSKSDTKELEALSVQIANLKKELMAKPKNN